MPHLITAVTHHTPVVLTQARVPGKTSEIPAVRALLADLDLSAIAAARGRGPVVVTVDALHTHPTTAAAVLAAGGHYVMTVKGNTPRLRTTVITALGESVTTPGATHAEVSRGHGRTDERYARAAPAAGVDFPGAQQAIRLVRYRGELTGQRLTKGSRPRGDVPAR